MGDATVKLRDVIVSEDGHIGLDDYPIFDEGHRAVLNDKIIRHYFTREIGSETESMFVYRMRTKMGEIMPPYNKFYESELIQFDALSTVNLKTTSNSTGTQVTDTDANGTNTTENTAGGKTIAADYPQNQLQANENYATSGSENSSQAKVDSESAETNHANVANEDNAESTTTGYQGPASELLLRFRATILNIDLSIIEDLDELFLGVYGNNNSFTSGGIY